MKYLRILSTPSNQHSNQSDSREAALFDFLNQQGWGDVEPLFLAGDASFRTYYRLQKQGRSVLFMDAPPPENPREFCQVDEYLIELGFSAPQIIASNFDHGFVLLEDFGDDTYTRLLNKGKDPIHLYELALDTLITLHKKATTCPAFIKPYTVERLLQEAELFVDWYLPAVASPLSQEARQSFVDLWSAAFSKALDTPHSLVLRDYHVDNLMHLPNREGIQACGLLDFQDALWGPAVYDVVSLVEDARLDIDPFLVESLWQRYGEAFPQMDLEQLRTAGCVLSAGRHAKIIGIFTRLAVRDHKTDYLKHLPRVWRLLEACLDHRELHELKVWFDVNAPVRRGPVL